MERWQAGRKGMELKATATLLGVDLNGPDIVAKCLGDLYADRPRQKVDLVIESALMPVILVDAGDLILSVAEVDALVRHHLGLHYDDGPHKVAGWTVRSDYLAGNRFVLACGMPPWLSMALKAAEATNSPRWRTILPALSAGWQRCRQSSGDSLHNGWLVWQEQDRSLVARLESGRVVGLNPGAPRFESAHDIDRLVRTESFRLGISTDQDRVFIGSWNTRRREAGRGKDSRHCWITLESPSSSVTNATPSAGNAKAVA